MPTGGYQIRDQHAIHFITFAVVEWVDVFTRKEYVDIVLDSLRYCQEKKGLQVACLVHYEQPLAFDTFHRWHPHTLGCAARFQEVHLFKNHSGDRVQREGKQEELDVVDLQECRAKEPTERKVPVLATGQPSHRMFFSRGPGIEDEIPS